MFIDNDTLLGTDLTCVGTATGAPVTVTGQTVYDLGNATNFLSGDDELYLVIQVATQITTAGAAGTISFSLVSSDDTTLVNTTGEATTHLVTGDVLTEDATDLATALAAEYGASGTLFTDPNVQANQTPGAEHVDGIAASPLPVIAVALPAGLYQRYVGIKRTITTTDTDAGAIDAAIVRSLESFFPHASYAT